MRRPYGILVHMLQVLFMVLIVSAYIFSLYITRREKRSFQSWFSERLLKFGIKNKLFIASDKPYEYLELRAVENEKTYSLPAPLKLISKVERIEIGGMDCVILSQGVAKTKYILYLHGGAYVDQPLLPHWVFLEQVVKGTQATINVPLYPKAPVHQYQETYDKLLFLYRNILAHTRHQDVVFMGDSAGGGLALGFSQYLCKEGLPQPERLILISPWLDISLENPGIDELEMKDPMLLREHLKIMGKAWAGDTDRRDYRLSPINGSLRGLPPISLFVGTYEIFLADARKFKIRALAQGAILSYHEYPKMNHDFPLFPIPEARKVLQEIIWLLGGQMGPRRKSLRFMFAKFSRVRFSGK
jgi:acetyl esterase/lipase